MKNLIVIARQITTKVNRKFFLTLCGYTFCTAACAASQYAIYVDAVNGNDSNPGTSVAPVKTILQAKNIVRLNNAAATQDINVYIKAGFYQLNSPLSFNSADSGNGYRVIYQSYGAGRAVISGGIPITGWQSEGVNGIYSAQTAPGLAFRQLYSGDIPKQRPHRARYPKAGNYEYVGWFELTRPTNPGIVLQSDSTFSALPTSLFSGSEMVIEKNIAQSRLHVAGVTNPTAQNGLTGPLISLDSGSTSCERNAEPNYSAASSPEANGGHNYGVYFENSRSILTSTGVPGEWYLNPTSGVVEYIPQGIDGSTANLTLYAPNLQQLIDINGANNIVFYGLEFRHTGWMAPNGSINSNGTTNTPAAYVGIQASRFFSGCPTTLTANGASLTNIPSGITIINSTGAAFYGNVIAQFGGSGIAIRTNTSNISIQGNYFSDISASGIRIETESANSSIPISAATGSTGNLIADNYLIGIGEDYDGVGILAMMPGTTQILRNKLQFVSYTGISLGWGWNIGLPSTANQPTIPYPTASYLSGNAISYNDIGDVMQSHLDGGGIYTLPLGVGQGTPPTQANLISSNRVHDFYGSLALSGFSSTSGIYLDHQTGYVSVGSNQLSNLNAGIFLQNATTNPVVGNVVAMNYLSNIGPIDNLNNTLSLFPEFGPPPTQTPGTNSIYSNTVGGTPPALATGPQAVYQTMWAPKLGYANLGFFKVGTSTFYSYGTTYCGFPTSQSFFNAWGASNTQNVPAYDSQPVLESYLGFCST